MAKMHKSIFRTDINSLTIKYLCQLGVLLLLSNTLVAQQDSIDVELIDFFNLNYVKWTGEIPSSDAKAKSLKNGWFKKIILGKSEINSFQKPMDIIPIDDKNLFVLDQGNGTIFFTDGHKLDIPKVIRKRDSLFPSIVAACKLPNMNLLFTDSKLNSIFVLSNNQKRLTNLNKNLDLRQPTGVAYNSSTNRIWVVETGDHKISVLDVSGNRLKSIGKRGNGEGEFNYPTSIWIDKQGQAYVVDTLNYRVQIFDAEGNFISMFGENGNGTGFIASPKGIATDSHGHIYLVDALFHGVQIFDQEGNYLYQFGTQGRGKGEFWMPSGIFIDQMDHIYVADSYNTRIQIYELVFTK